MTTHVKRAFKFRFYPTDAQAAELSRTFGCVR
ncbi:helix-turn-helix domain-containing protein, partial [Streptomyces sp. NPDC005388]